MDLQPVAVCEAALPSTQYNALPYVNAAHDTTTNDGVEEGRSNLLQLISDHGLSDIFSVHLLHRHFSVPEAQVMVYQTIAGSEHPTFQVMAPRKPEEIQSLCGRFFFAAPDGSMTAYEFSSDPQPDILQYQTFCALFWKEITRLNLQHVYALGLRPDFTLGNCTEVEVPDAHATVFVENLQLAGGFGTDWSAPSRRWDKELPFNQSKTLLLEFKRSKARHTAMGPESWAVDDQGRDALNLEGHCLPAGCGPFQVLTNAMKYVAAV